ncbi:MAG: hypothetical protein RLZZ26_191 [Candidatus Parcubacteria bacterium]|jgi:hypothetical protein
MITSIGIFFSAISAALGAALMAVLISTASFLGYPHIPNPLSILVVTPATIDAPGATSSPSRSAGITAEKVPPPKIVLNPARVSPKPPVTIPVSRTSPAVSTTTEVGTIGTTTLAVESIPLLSGGVVHAGGLVPISYLQITNVGTAGAMLKGFWIKQDGSALPNAISGFSTVDDKGGSRGVSSGATGSALFLSGLAFASTTAYFAPGQMRLFTIKTLVAPVVTDYVGTELKLEVVSIETTAEPQGNFPIQGTTWLIVQ